jgi:hypothetical protein
MMLLFVKNLNWRLEKPEKTGVWRFTCNQRFIESPMDDATNLEAVTIKLCEIHPEAVAENRELVYFIASTLLRFRSMDEESSSERLSM